MKSSSPNITTLNVEGMTCNNCAAGIKKHLENNSINDVDVNFSLGEVSFTLQKNEGSIFSRYDGFSFTYDFHQNRTIFA